MNKFIFTCGDINGIGPEIVIKTLNKFGSDLPGKMFFICPENVFEETIKIIPARFNYEIITPKMPAQPGIVTLINIGNYNFNPGIGTKQSGKAAFNAIKLAFEFVKHKKADAMVTAPISKLAISKAGYDFPGHTEMLAEWSGSKDFVMMFLSKKMVAALITIHEPLRRVPVLINKKMLKDKIEIIINSLKYDLNINKPRAAVLGLNPHAGESGIIGKEEKKIISPLIESAQFDGKVSGPFSPDAFFANKLYKKYDVVIGMYHDQILIPFKLINFGAGVNYTAGLKLIRTSPDHGTAFDIAMKNKASESSFFEAFLYAQKIVKANKALIL